MQHTKCERQKKITQSRKFLLRFMLIIHVNLSERKIFKRRNLKKGRRNEHDITYEQFGYLTHFILYLFKPIANQFCRCR